MVTATDAAPADSTARTWTGTPVVPGVAHAPALVARAEVSPAAIARFTEQHATSPLEPDAALERYDAAVQAVADGFGARAEAVSGAAAEVLTASAGLARDKGLRGAVRTQLRADHDLVTAVHAAVEQFAGVFTSMGGLMAERVTDLRDIERRVVARVVGEEEPGAPSPRVASVLVAEDLAPSDTATLDPALVLALVTERGGPTSHTAIIARQLGIPCVVGVTGIMDVDGGTPLLVDGTTGTVESGADAEEAERLVAQDVEQRRALETWAGPGATADGHEVKVLANVADGESSAAAAAFPVQGVGLFRTELCFLNRTEEPSVEEQTAIYADVLRPFRDHYVVVRTLDAGSDKPVAFATHEGEENPALGVRGLRLSFDNPGLLERQLDAVAAAAEETGTETWVMAPMVATVAEARDFAAQVRARGLQGGGDGRGPERGAAGLADARRGRLHVHRHQRPHPVRHGRGPDGHRPRAPHRPLAARRAAAHRVHRPRGPGGRQAGRRVRRGRRRPAAGHGAGRSRHHLAVDGRRRDPPGRGPPGRHDVRRVPGGRRGRPGRGGPRRARLAVRAVLDA